MQISESDFNTKVIRNHIPTIVSFGAAWSGNTEMLTNIITRLTSNEFPSQVEFCWTDVEANQGLADEWGIREIPTTLIFCDGEVVDSFVGIMSKGKIKERIEAIL